MDLPDILETHEDDRVSVDSNFSDVSLPPIPESLSSTNQKFDGQLDANEKDKTSGISTNDTLELSDQEDSGGYDTDIEIDEDGIEVTKVKDSIDQEVGREDYKKSCNRLNISPENKIVENLSSTTLNLAHQGIGEDGAKALAKSLMKNTKVMQLKLEDNSITPLGVAFLMDMLSDNIYITYLDISNNDVGTYGSMALKETLISNTTLLTLILKDCKIKDSDCILLAEGVQCCSHLTESLVNILSRSLAKENCSSRRNESVVYLDLSHNEICEDGAMCLGDAIAINNGIEQLSLSWNHIRRKGAVQICKGLKRNYSIAKVDLSWNGLGYEGSLSLGQALKVNKHIEEIDVSSNRINWKCATTIASGLKDNYTLQVLKIGLNPLTMTGVQELLASVSNDHSEMEYMSFEGIPINRKIAYMAETLSNSREFSMSHGGVIDTDDVMGKKKINQDDPFTRLLTFLNERSIRAVDLFRGFQKDKDQTVSREQFIAGLKAAQAPLETWEMVKVMEKLDKSETGKLDYRRLNDGIHQQMVANKQKEDKAKAEARRKLREERKMMNPELSLGASANRASSAQGMASSRSSLASVPNSRRTSRVSLNIVQGNLEVRRRSSLNSLLSSRSTAPSPKLTRGGSSASRSVLNAAVNSHRKGAREREMMQKLDRLSVGTGSVVALAAPGTIGKNQSSFRRQSLVGQQ